MILPINYTCYDLERAVSQPRCRRYILGQLRPLKF